MQPAMKAVTGSSTARTIPTPVSLPAEVSSHISHLSLTSQQSTSGLLHSTALPSICKNTDELRLNYTCVNLFGGIISVEDIINPENKV